MRGRPELPDSYMVDLNAVINIIFSEAVRTGTPFGWDHTDYDIVIPVYESFKEDVAKNIIFLLDRKIYRSNKSRFIEPLEAKRGVKGEDTYYIYDKFKSDSLSHKKSYKQFMVDIPYPEKGKEPIFIPVYWRVN